MLDGVVIERAPEPEVAQTPPVRPPHTNGKATVVASALNLSGYARGLLSEELGEDYIVLDFADAPSTADVLIVGPISRNLVARLSLMFPNARVMIIEVGDEQLGIDSEGPVRRLLDVGAETYLVSSTIPNLAAQLDQAITRPALTSGTRPQVEIENVTTSFLGETDSSDW